MTFKLTKLLAALGLALATGSASAGITWYSPITGFEDDDLEWVYKDVSGATGTGAADGKLSVGDQLIAVFEIDQTFRVLPAGASADITGGELTGISAIQVIAKLGGAPTPTLPGDPPAGTCTALFSCTYIFGPVSQGMDAIMTDLGLATLASQGATGGGAGEGAMAAGWFDTTPNLDVVTVNCTTLADCASKGSDGALWEVDGFSTDPDRLWISTGVIAESFSTIKAGNATQSFGSYNFALSIFYNGTGQVLGEQACGLFCGTGGDGMIEVTGSGQILGGQGLATTLGAFGRSDFDFQKAPVAVPEPGTLALLAVALLGLGQTIRRRRQQ